jgi:hypothetical protein
MAIFPSLSCWVSFCFIWVRPISDINLAASAAADHFWVEKLQKNMIYH